MKFQVELCAFSCSLIASFLYDGNILMFRITKHLFNYTFRLTKRQGVCFMFPQKIFAERLKQLRSEHKVSMQKLAEEIGLKNKGTIGQFETEVTVPSADTLISLADYFNVSLDYLVGRSDDSMRH